MLDYHSLPKIMSFIDGIDTQIRASMVTIPGVIVHVNDVVLESR